MKGDDIVFDEFEPVISASKGYVISGEQYAADIFLSAYSSSAGDNTRISVNGNALPVEGGKATYETTTRGIGPRKYEVKIDVTNPLTKEIKTYTKEFEYEVGRRSVTVSADKMNVFYIGVDNPISVAAAGIPTSDLQVRVNGSGGKIKKVNDANYIVNVSEQGEATVTVSGGGMRVPKVFRVKKIPNPEARLGRSTGGSIGSGEFRAQAGLLAILDNFDFDAKCKIDRFEMVYVAPRQDAVPANNQGPVFSGRVRNLISRAKPGDTYYFRDVRAICPGDKRTRKINDMVFNIK